MDVVQRFRRFHVQQTKSGIRHLQIIFFLDAPGIFNCRAVRTGRTGGDHIQRIAQDIGKHHGLDLGRPAELREAAAFDGAQTLADRIDLHDVGTAGQKLTCDILQFFTADERFLEQGASTAGEHEQHGVFLA